MKGHTYVHRHRRGHSAFNRVVLPRLSRLSRLSAGTCSPRHSLLPPVKHWADRLNWPRGKPGQRSLSTHCGRLLRPITDIGELLPPLSRAGRTLCGFSPAMASIRLTARSTRSTSTNTVLPASTRRLSPARLAMSQATMHSQSNRTTQWDRSHSHHRDRLNFLKPTLQKNGVASLPRFFKRCGVLNKARHNSHRSARRNCGRSWDRCRARRRARLPAGPCRDRRHSRPCRCRK